MIGPDIDSPGKRLIELPELYPAQEQIKSEARRFNVLDIGRRAGKTYLGIHLALETATDGHPVGWFAPNYKYLLEVWQTLTRILRPVANKINATERRVELTNGGILECWTLDGSDDPGRSRKYKRVIVDEAAIAANLKRAWEEAIRPTLTDLQGEAWFLSTPKGLNAFYELFQRGQDSLAHPDWRSWQMPSAVNPYLPTSEMVSAEKELPQMVFQQEYLAQFIQSDGAVFRNIPGCLHSSPTTPEAHRNHHIVLGVDWGQKNDFTVVSAFCSTCRREVHLDRFNKIEWSFQRERVKTIYDKWNVRDGLVELNSIGSPNFEALLPDCPNLRGFETTGSSKSPLIQSLALAFEREEAQWLPDPVAKLELMAYESKVSPTTGRITYGAPDGTHDDTVIARALAWRAAIVPEQEPQQSYSYSMFK